MIASPRITLSHSSIPNISNKHYAYPEIDVKVADWARFPVRNLIRDGHLVVRVQIFEEALAGMRPQQDRVRIAEV
jgi:hypothetical protein